MSLFLFSLQVVHGVLCSPDRGRLLPYPCCCSGMVSGCALTCIIVTDLIDCRLYVLYVSVNNVRNLLSPWDRCLSVSFMIIANAAAFIFFAVRSQMNLLG